MIGELLDWRQCFGCWWPIAERTVRTNRVVVNPPLFDQYLSFSQGVEQFPIQQLVSELAVEALVVAVLPGTAGLNEERFHFESLQPFTHCGGGKLSAVV
jgi:hypothetical protein